MKIAVLVWGSLWWDPRDLRISENGWSYDGPNLPLEFARISSGNRLTLVIKPGWDDVTTLYGESPFDNLDMAIENLRSREGTTTPNIGFYNFVNFEYRIGRAQENLIPRLLNWRSSHEFDAVIWTDLAPNFSNTTNRTFNIDNIKSYLNELTSDELDNAEKYVVNAPPQIKTRFRNEIESYYEGRKNAVNNSNNKISDYGTILRMNNR